MGKRMKLDAYMPFFWTKFEASTPGWPERDRWSYLRAICFYWWGDCIGLPSDDDENLRDLCSCRDAADWARRKGQIFGPKFKLRDGRWHNNFAAELWQESNRLLGLKREQTEAAREAALQARTERATHLVTQSVTELVTGPNQSQSQSQKEKKRGGPAQAPEAPSEVQVWNSQLNLPRCLTWNGSRFNRLKIRRTDPFFQTNFVAAVERVTKSDFCTGQNDRGWKATFDWILQPDVVAKIMEGKYDNRTNPFVSYGRPVVPVKGSKPNNGF